MHVAGFVIPVPEENQSTYRLWAANSAKLFREYGCLEIVECWEDNVPDGKHTDFRRAVDAKAGEKIVFTWQIWSDKATLEAAEERMSTDPCFDIPEDIPFDPTRLIFGTFTPIHASLRSQGEKRAAS
ncbi:MAG: DUF1428 domain-containing protein [Ruegeria sp.]|uniref:DUF1428 domain-containing protein n=1 Tax=Ruegeria sp. TaxID=1879320 RepID=UPI00349EE5F5